MMRRKEPIQDGKAIRIFILTTCSFRSALSFASSHTMCSIFLDCESCLEEDGCSWVEWPNRGPTCEAMCKNFFAFVWVTRNITECSPSTVSEVAKVDPGDPTVFLRAVIAVLVVLLFFACALLLWCGVKLGRMQCCRRVEAGHSRLPELDMAEEFHTPEASTLPIHPCESSPQQSTAMQLTINPLFRNDFEEIAINDIAEPLKTSTPKTAMTPMRSRVNTRAHVTNMLSKALPFRDANILDEQNTKA